jgi:hypothetical protein
MRHRPAGAAAHAVSGQQAYPQLVIQCKVIANVTDETLVVHPGRQHRQREENPAQ